LKAPGMLGGRLLRACLVISVFAVAIALTRPAQAQANFDRPGGDYQSSPVASGDPMECALACERDRRCHSWSFAYPTEIAGSAMCWLKSTVPARVPDNSSISGVRGAGVVEPHSRGVETSIDRAGGDYRSFDLKSGEGEEACRLACTAENKCRAWTFARPGYVGREPHCFLKKEIKPPRRRPGFISGVVR
jgi:PAN domain